MIPLLMAGAIGLVVSLLGTRYLIDWLRAHRVGQPIHDDVQVHSGKAGTPTMGGVAIVVAAVAGYGAAHFNDGLVFTRSGVLVMLTIAASGVVGAVDDWIKVSQERNLGLSSRAKMGGLLLVAVGFAVAALSWTDVETTVSFTRWNEPGWELGNVGWLILAVLLIAGTTNAVNLTDGLDGLAAGSSLYAFGAMTVIGFWAFRHPDVYQVEHALDLAVIAAAMVGATIGFLWWNAPPAQIFMGDTGSLALGAGLATPVPDAQHPAAAADRRRPVRVRDGVGDRAGRQLPHLPPPGAAHGPDPPPLRAGRLARDHGDHPLLAAGPHVDGGGPRPLSTPTSSRRGRSIERALPGHRAGRDRHGRGPRPGRPRRGRGAGRRPPRRRRPGAGRRAGLRPGRGPGRRRAGPPGEGRVRRGARPGLPDRHPRLRGRGRGRGADPLRVRPGRLVGRPARARHHRHRRQDHRHHARPRHARGSGLAAAAVGNTDVPLVAAIDDPATDVFVVEASSFRLEHSRRFTPQVATWLNFAPDHLDVHPTLAAYEAAKARIWRDQAPDQVAVANLDDPVVARHLRRAAARQVPFGLDAGAEVTVADGVLVGPGGVEVVAGGRAAPPAAPRRVQRPRGGGHGAQRRGDAGGRRRRAAGLHGAPPPGGAGGGGWRRAVLRRLQGDHAPRRRWPRCRASTRS